MNLTRAGLPFAIFISACLVFTGCRPKAVTMRLAVNDTYCKATACLCIQDLASREYEEVVGMLRDDYDISLELVYCMEESDLEDSIRSGHFDGAICKPWFALRHMPVKGMRFERITDVLDPFDNGLLGGIFIVRKESSLMGPEDINGRIIAIGEENSYEKYHLALSQMEEKGIRPEKIIKKSVCTEGINALLDREADVAVISDYALVASCAADFAEENAFRTIWKTGDIPLCSVVLDLKRVSRKDAARLQSALLEISEEKIPESFASKGFIKPVPWKPKPYKGELK
ncbi:MAG: PhnD/SsuA/transferrin family substrate-binding protein [Bacteroidota bacterium]